MISGEIDSTLLFPLAATIWLEARTFSGSARHRYIKPRTIKSYKDYIKALGKFFKSLKVDEIHLGHFREYQLERSGKVGPNKINQELWMLVQILKRCGSWTQEMQDWYEPLQREETDIPHALTIEEQERFLQVLSSREEYEVIYWYTLIALSTTCGTLEMRQIQLGHVNVSSGTLNIPTASAKNKYRQRTVPLDDQAKWAIGELVKRAQSLGANQPQQYLFPFRLSKDSWDVTKPMSEWGLRKIWERACTEAGFKLRQYDLRHTAITRYAEAGTPIPVIMAYAGHISMKMFRHYCAVCEQAQRQWQKRTQEMRPKMGSMWKTQLSS